MGGSRTPGAVGLDPDALDGGDDEIHQPIVGIAEGAEALDNQKKIKTVTRDWTDPPKPRVVTTPEVTGKTLAEALKQLEKLPEWGTGGGNLSGTGDPVGEGQERRIQLESTDGKNFTCDIKGDFFITLPGWKGYADATAPQKQAWDNMISQLRKHEEKHVAIAYAGAQALIRSLTNLNVDLAMQKIQESGEATQKAQDDFDSEGKTDHGRKPWGGFPKVELDTSADPPPPPPPPTPTPKEPGK